MSSWAAGAATKSVTQNEQLDAVNNNHLLTKESDFGTILFDQLYFPFWKYLLTKLALVLSKNDLLMHVRRMAMLGVAGEKCGLYLGGGSHLRGTLYSFELAFFDKQQ